jgi:uncharacterized protein
VLLVTRGGKSSLRALALYAKENAFVVSPFVIEDEHGECADAKLSSRDVKRISVFNVDLLEESRGAMKQQDMTFHRSSSIVCCEL